MNDPSTRHVSGHAREGLFTLNGRYVAEHELARGGMGTVYGGRDSVLERPVAIKVLLPEPGAEPRNEFLREARAVAALKHPHIVDVYDAGVEGEKPYIVMEYVPGETLRELIARDAPVEPVRAAALAAEIASALDYAHRRGVVHCDIKPGNILLPAEDLPKIVDFGIAHSAGATGTFTDTVLGTAAYISPEQVQGERPDGRADVYSLAAVLYEMLIGQPPFAGRNLAAVAAQRLTQNPTPPHERNAAVPPDLSRVVMRGLAREREDRYASAAEFATALREFVEGVTRGVTRVVRPVARTSDAEPVTIRREAHPWGQPEAVDETVRGRRAPWAALAVIGAVLAGAMAAAVILASGLIGGGGTTVTVPDVVNMTLLDAPPLLQARGLDVDVSFTSRQGDYGTVVDQEPKPSSRVKSGSTVTLTVIQPPQ